MLADEAPARSGSQSLLPVHSLFAHGHLSTSTPPGVVSNSGESSLKIFSPHTHLLFLGGIGAHLTFNFPGTKTSL
jgi:hypothetical protein